MRLDSFYTELRKRNKLQSTGFYSHFRTTKRKPTIAYAGLETSKGAIVQWT